MYLLRPSNGSHTSHELKTRSQTWSWWGQAPDSVPKLITRCGVLFKKTPSIKNPSSNSPVEFFKISSYKIQVAYPGHWAVHYPGLHT